MRLLSRQTGTADTIEIYAEAGPKSVCTMTRHTMAGSTIGAMGCGLAVDDAGAPTVQAGVSLDFDDTYLLTALVPDGVESLALRFTDNTAIPLTRTNNTALYHGTRRPSVLTYTDPAGAPQEDHVSLPEGRAG